LDVELTARHNTVEIAVDDAIDTPEFQRIRLGKGEFDAVNDPILFHAPIRRLGLVREMDVPAFERYKDAIKTQTIDFRPDMAQRYFITPD